LQLALKESKSRKETNKKKKNLQEKEKTRGEDIRGPSKKEQVQVGDYLGGISPAPSRRWGEGGKIRKIFKKEFCRRTKKGGRGVGGDRLDSQRKEKKNLPINQGLRAKDRVKRYEEKKPANTEIHHAEDFGT